MIDEEDTKERVDKILDNAPASTKAIYRGTTLTLYIGAVAVGLACVPPFSLPVAAAGLTLGLASIFGKAFILAEQEKRQNDFWNEVLVPKDYKGDEPKQPQKARAVERVETNSNEDKQARTQTKAPNAALMKHFRDVRSK